MYLNLTALELSTRQPKELLNFIECLQNKVDNQWHFQKGRYYLEVIMISNIVITVWLLITSS